MLVNGNYESVTLGVSEQNAQDRLEGQHSEQVNLISDIKRGTARRHGSIFQAEYMIKNNYTQEDLKATEDDMRTFSTSQFFVGSEEYTVLTRRKNKIANSVAEGIYVYHSESKQFIPIVTASQDDKIKEVLDGGISASINIGRYMMLAGNTVKAENIEDNKWGGNGNRDRCIFWVRQGAYVREYTCSVGLSYGTITVSYKTPSSVYTGFLDLSDLDPQSPSYQHMVNQRQAMHDKAMNDHMQYAADSIVPKAIAYQLANQLNAHHAGLAWVHADSYIVINASGVTEITASDSSDGDSLWSIGSVVTAPEKVSPQHWIGKVVKVKPERATEDQVYYLQAEAKIPNSTGWGEVIWREAAGLEFTPTYIVSVMTVHEGKAYLASTPAIMKELTGLPSIDYQKNKVGDGLTSPLPYFFNRKIDYLGIHQDRLVIGSGATLMFSKSGDYFNFFRGSILTMLDNDPFELYALDSEDDTIASSVIFDRNLILFGKRKQYVVSGRQIVSPTTASVISITAYEDAVDASPVVTGQHLYFATHRHDQTSLHQMQIGIVQDAPEARSVSLQLDKYIKGIPVDIKAVTTPNVVFLRTTGYDRGIYVYNYLDDSDGRTRIHEAWSRWEFNKSLGNIVGLGVDSGDPVLFTLRGGESTLNIVVDKINYESIISNNPYIDSQFPDTKPYPLWFNDKIDTDDVIISYNKDSEAYLMGAYWDDPRDLYLPSGAGVATVGVEYNSYVKVTSPYIRNNEGKAVISGHLTIMNLDILLETTTAMNGYVEAYNERVLTYKYEGRQLNRDTSEIGIVPYPTRLITMPIGRSNRDYEAVLTSYQWFPMTISAISWKGQLFKLGRSV